MKKTPLLDSRTLDDLRQEVAARAAAYTPEWRLERTKDDAGAAIAELFCRMQEQTIDRMNSVPTKLYAEFLNQIGFSQPAPVPAVGVMQFTAHDTVEQPVRVPAGTQVFTPDEQGENIVYETERVIEATPAQLTDIFYADSTADRLERLDMSRPQYFFETVGENLQRHCFWLGRQDVLQLDCPCIVEAELQLEVRYLETDTAQKLAAMQWSYLHAGKQLAFDAVTADNGRIRLEKRNALTLDTDAAGNRCIFCTGKPEVSLTLAGITLRSAPIQDIPAQALFCGDIPIAEEGYCFGQRPAPYGLFYIRSDTVLTKCGAEVCVHLDIVPVVQAPPEQPPQYNFTQHIINKEEAVAAKPDDVFVSAVTWEYFNGIGWRRLEVIGDRNPFSCKREGALETRFTVPQDIASTEINAEAGFYIRARVTEIENEFSLLPRRILPFVRGVQLDWAYENLLPAAYCGAENNGSSLALNQTETITNLQLPALVPMEQLPRAMYVCFDRSPHAMPFSLRFEVIGSVPLTDKLLWESWDGTRFDTVSAVDLTGSMKHTGQVLLYLSEPLPECTLFGQTGCWLRVTRSSGFAGAAPRIASVLLNTVAARQVQREEDLYFGAAPYDAGKTVTLLRTPVVSCSVWMDEVGALSLADAQELARTAGDRVKLEWTDSVLTHCWVNWQQVENLALSAPSARAFVLDPQAGTVTFGDGHCGRVPAAGDRTIRISYVSGGGARGNVPAGRVNALVGSLPRISGVINRTAMSGGIDGFPDGRIEEIGSRRLRHRGRAAGVHDFEEMVLEQFPQVQHIKCFSGRDEKGNAAHGHITVVVTGMGDSTAANALCTEIEAFLFERSSCCLVGEGRLHVCPATVLTISTRITVHIENLDRAAEIQQDITERLEDLINHSWKTRQIGAQIRTEELWRTVRDTAGVQHIERILIEGAYDRDGQPQLAPIEHNTDFPYAVVHSGVHHVRVY